MLQLLQTRLYLLDWKMSGFKKEAAFLLKISISEEDPADRNLHVAPVAVVSEAPTLLMSWQRMNQQYCFTC